MAAVTGKKITQLPLLSEIGSSAEFATAQNGVTYRVGLNTVLQRIYSIAISDLATTGTLNATYDNGTVGVGATLTNAGALATLSIDGVTTTTGMLILVKDQSNTFQNGIYEVTEIGSASVAWVLTRPTFYDDTDEIEPGDFFTVAQGTVNGKVQFIQTEIVSTVGTDPILFESNIIAGIGLIKENNTISSLEYTQYSTTADATVVNVASGSILSATGVGTSVIPANIFQIGSILRLRALGHFTMPGAASTLNITISLNATNVLTTGAFAATTGVSNFQWELDALLTVRTIGGTGSIIGQGTFKDQATATTRFARSMVNTATSAIDTTVTQTVGITAAWGTPAPGKTITCTNAIIEILNPIS